MESNRAPLDDVGIEADVDAGLDPDIKAITSTFVAQANPKPPITMVQAGIGIAALAAAYFIVPKLFEKGILKMPSTKTEDVAPMRAVPASTFDYNR